MYIHVNHLRGCANIYHLKRVWPLIRTNLKLHHQWKHWAKFGRNWHGGSKKENIMWKVDDDDVNDDDGQRTNMDQKSLFDSSD